MLIPDISCFENSVDLDQLALEKPADQYTYCYLFCIQVHANIMGGGFQDYS